MNKTNTVLVRLDDNDLSLLVKLAESKSLTRSDILRKLIRLSDIIPDLQWMLREAVTKPDNGPELQEQIWAAMDKVRNF